MALSTSSTAAQHSDSFDDVIASAAMPGGHGGDGQSAGDHVLKHSARRYAGSTRQDSGRVRRSTADAFSLFARFETKLEQYAAT